MKPLFYRFLLLFLFALIISCEKKGYHNLYEIPEEDRCVFSIGDMLLYNCNDGTIDSVFIKDIKFWSESGSDYNGFGGYTFYKEYYKITIQSSSDNWNEILNNNDALRNAINENRYYTIETGNYLFYNSKTPCCHLSRGCDEISPECKDLIFSTCATKGSITLNNQTFRKVYYTNWIEDNIEIFWNLKYGIISFKGKSGDSVKIWTLVGKI